MIPVKIIRHINIRKGPGKSFASIGTTMPSGRQVMMESKVSGENINGISDWYLLTNTNGVRQYYWGGGVEELAVLNTSGISFDFQDFINKSFDGNTLQRTISYSSLLNIGSEYKIAGKEIVVAIIDHSISEGIQPGIRIERPLVSIGRPANAHANFILGLIGGIQGILGVAQNVKFVSLPIYDEYGFPIEGGIEKALNYVRNSDNPMIVNISNSFGTNYDAIIDQFSTNKIIVTCSGVNDELTSGAPRYPASRSDVISVGAIDRDFSITGLKRKVDVLLPNFSYVSFDGPGTYSMMKGDSFSTAIVSGVVAQIISSGHSDFNVASIKGSLNSVSLAASDPAAFSTLSLIKSSL